MLVPRLMGALFATAALSCTPAAQVEPAHPPAPTHAAPQTSAPRAECEALADRLCRDLGASPACQAVRVRTPEFTTSKCTEIIEHYAEVLADLKQMNLRLEPLPLAVSDAITTPEAPGLGNPSAPIQLVVFWDYDEAYSAKAFGAFREVYRRLPNEVRVAVAQYPLAFHPHAALAAEAALAAHASPITVRSGVAE